MSAMMAASIISGILANASSLGAKTVNGPGPSSVSVNPVVFSASIKVLKLPAVIAVSMILVDVPAGVAAGAGYAGRCGAENDE